MTTTRSSMRSDLRAVSIITLSVIVTLAVLTACGAVPEQQRPADKIAAQRQNYVPKNDIEGKNYNRRGEVADDPTTILWCTTFPASPTAPMETYAIVGKLTSGSKRPYPTSQQYYGNPGAGYQYTPELPGPDGMFGASDAYRYGFTPNGAYVDFTDIPTVCSTEPTVAHRQTIQTADAGLAAAQTQARAALASGDDAGAATILNTALGVR